MNNFTQSSNYKVGCSLLGDSAVQVQNVTVPGINFSVPEIAGNAGAKVFMSGDSMLYDSIAFDIILDEQLTVYKEVIKKIIKNINPNDGIFNNIEYDLWIEITDSLGKPIIKLEYFGCRIESAGPIDFTSASEDTELVWSITMRFDDFNMIETNETPSLIV